MAQHRLIFGVCSSELMIKQLYQSLNFPNPSFTQVIYILWSFMKGTVDVNKNGFLLKKTGMSDTLKT